MKKLAISALCILLSAVLVCGCSDKKNGASSASGAPAPTPTTAPTAPPPADDAESSSVPADGLSAFSGTEEALKGILDYEDGTTGSSLKAAGAASALLNWARDNEGYDAETLRGGLREWFDGLTEEEQLRFSGNLNVVLDQADQLLADPAGTRGLLDSAGIADDYTDYSADFDGLRTALRELTAPAETAAPQTDSAAVSPQAK